MSSGEKVLESSDLAYEDTLNLFSVPVSNLGVTDVKYLTHKPVNQFSAEGDVKFHVPGVGTSYIDLSNVYLSTRVRIVRGDGSRLPEGGEDAAAAASAAAADASAAAAANDESAVEADEGVWSVGPVNNLAHALWDQVEVRLNDRVVTGGQTGYSYKALMNTLLGETELNDSELENSLFHKDTTGFMNDVSLAFGSNSGLKKRASAMSGSRTVELLGKVDVDVFKANKYLLNGVTIDLNLTPTSNKFRLQSANRETTDYKLEIVDITLILKHVTPSGLILLGHQDVMLKEISRAKYFYTKEELRKFNLARDTSSYYIEDAFNGRVPSKIVLGFVSGESMGGSLTKNPYNFMHYDITFINVSLSGTPTPRGPLNLDFSEDKYLHCYSELYKGKPNYASNARINREEYRDGYTLFVIDLAPQNYDEFYPVTREGCVRIELRFKSPLKESVVMLTKVTYPGLFEIDYARNLYLT
jgi:hypothetical protein